MIGHPSAPATARLAAIARSQVRRDPWPDFEAFDPARYDAALRRRTARQWWRRAREEYGSIHEFTGVAHALGSVGAPIDLLAAASRLITDEARHAELCATMARTLVPDAPPEEIFEWEAPRDPWPPAPTQGDEAVLRWAADAVLCSCCIGESLSLPLFEALAMRTTDPVPEAVVRQILRDEHLHATFGWEALAWLRARLEGDSLEWLEGRLAKRLGGFERTCAAGVPLASLVGREIVVEPAGPDAEPNLGLLDHETYATIFYATLESQVLPRFAELGFDHDRAWRERAR